MRPYGTSIQLQKRRERAQKLRAKGATVEQVARKIGVTPRSVYRWQREEKHPKKKKVAPPGKPAYLSEKQIKRLEKQLLRGAYAHGYSEDYWTLERITHLVWELFKVRYTLSGMWRVLYRMGWSCQKIQRLALQRQEESIARWTHYVWPRVKKNGAS